MVLGGFRSFHVLVLTSFLKSGCIPVVRFELELKTSCYGHCTIFVTDITVELFFTPVRKNSFVYLGTFYN